MPIPGLEKVVRKRSESYRENYWSWGIYGEPGSCKTRIVKDAIECGEFSPERVLVIDSEYGDVSLGNLNVNIIHLAQATLDYNLNHPWLGFKRVVSELNKQARAAEPYPYDLIVLEGTSLIADWCESWIVSKQKNKGPADDLAGLLDYRVLLNNVVAEFYNFKKVPVNKMITARMRTDEIKDVSGEVQRIRMSPKFIPSLSSEFLAVWDIATMAKFEVTNTGNQPKLTLTAAPTPRSQNKDRYGILKHQEIDPDIGKIVRALNMSVGYQSPIKQLTA